MTHKFEALIYAVIFTFWTVRLYYKLYDKSTRKYILNIGILIVFLMFVRMLKGVVELDILKRLCWYLYYVSLIFIPTIYYICSRSLLNKMTKKKKMIIYIISSILLLLVLTNDYHEIVFRFNNGLGEYDDYKHQIGYYLVSIWIFYLFGGGMISLAVNRWSIKRDFKAFLPLLVLGLGITYTILYVIDINGIREINMSVVNSILICVGIELAFYLNLIPNNRKYIKTFENSNLNMIVVSLDGKTIYTTRTFKEIPMKIKRDMISNKVRERYKNKNIIYNVRKNKDSYIILKNDMTLLYRLKDEVSMKQKELLEMQKSIKLEEKTKRELYEITLRKEVVTKIEDKLNEKRIEAKNILKKKVINDDDLEKIKRIIIYSKKKSSIMISELNNEIYNEESIRILLNELLNSMSSLNISGLAKVNNKMLISSNCMSKIYDIVYEVLDNLRDAVIMIYIKKEEEQVYVKTLISTKIKLKDKLKIDSGIKIKENIYDKDTELLFTIRDGECL